MSPNRMAAVPEGCRYPEKRQQVISDSATLEWVGPRPYHCRTVVEATAARDRAHRAGSRRVLRDLRPLEDGDLELLRCATDERGGGGDQQQGAGDYEAGLWPEVRRQPVESPDPGPESGVRSDRLDDRADPTDRPRSEGHFSPASNLKKDEPVPPAPAHEPRGGDPGLPAGAGRRGRDRGNLGGGPRTGRAGAGGPQLLEPGLARRVRGRRGPAAGAVQDGPPRQGPEAVARAAETAAADRERDRPVGRAVRLPPDPCQGRLAPGAPPGPQDPQPHRGDLVEPERGSQAAPVRPAGRVNPHTECHRIG